MLQNLKLGKTTTSLNLTNDMSNVSSDGFNLSNKLTKGHFHSYTIDDVEGQNNSSEYYCTDDYGCYYNWYTATASSGTTSITSGNVDYSICPTGWQLPSYNDFRTLSEQYNFSGELMSVDNPDTTTENISGKIPGFLLSGFYTNGANALGVVGNYWSRTAQDTHDGRNLNIGSVDVHTNYHNYKYRGLAVRCLNLS